MTPLHYKTLPFCRAKTPSRVYGVVKYIRIRGVGDFGYKDPMLSLYIGNSHTH